jgi:hypothetical protein
MKASEIKLRLIASFVLICGAFGGAVQPTRAQSPTLTVSPTRLTFGVPSIGSTSAVESVTFSVTGSGSVTVGTVASSNPDFTSATDACSGATLTAPAACTVGVTFKPSVSGLETGMLTFPNNVSGEGGAPAVTLSGAAGAIKLFDPINVENSNPNATLASPFTFGSTTLTLSCPASTETTPLTAKLSSTPDGVGNVLVDNFLTVAVNGVAFGGGSPAGNVCTGGQTDFNGDTPESDCFTSAYQGPAANNQLDGQDPDNFAGPVMSTLEGASGGVSPLDVSLALTPNATQQTTFSLLDGGGKVASATTFLVTNCTQAGVQPGGSITGNPINPGDPGSQTPQFTFDATPGQHITFGADYLALDNTEAIQANTVPTTADAGITQETFEKMVSNTSAAPAQCIRVKGELAADGVTPLCKAFTIVCTTPSAQTPAGVNCPHSNARNLLFETRYDSAQTIDIDDGTGPGFLMGTDDWVASATTCTFTDNLLAGQLCPQNPLTEFKGAGDPVHGSTPRGTNSTFIPVMNMPLPSTDPAVTSDNIFGWQNNTTVNVKFSASPGRLPEDGEPNGFKPAPVESVTFGTTKATVSVPDTTFPVPGDITLFNPGGVGGSSACPSAPGGVFKTGPTNVPVDTSTGLPFTEGRYKLHFFATDCAETEELRFRASNNPNTNWASFKTVTVKIDLGAPIVNGLTLSTSMPKAGQTVTASYSCSDPLLADGSEGSGVVLCGTFLFFAADSTPTLHTKFVAKGVGAHVFSVTATDLAGNSTTVSVPYTVVSN